MSSTTTTKLESGRADMKGCARWQAETSTAIVVRSKGKYLSTMGFACDGQRLFPEEAVFLADSDEIDLIVCEKGKEERTLSKVEAFSLLGTSSIDMKAYTVYAALREQRFHVYRHGAWRESGKSWKDLPAPRVVKTLSQQIDPIPEVAHDKTDNKRLKSSSGASVEGNTIDEGLFISFDVYRPQSGFSKTRMGKPDFFLVVLSAEGRIPSVATLQQTLRQSEPSVPLRLAIVGDSSLTFLEVEEFDPKAENADAREDVKAE